MKDETTIMENYKQLFLDRWKELEHEIHLEKDEDGEIISASFLKKDVFYKFFTSPELLVGYYLWRGNGLAKDGGDAEYYFDLEYDGWTDDCKDIVAKAKLIFQHNQTITERTMNMQNLDIIIQFAMLWGETIGSATTAAEWEEAKVMKEYDSEELLKLFTEWKDLYLNQNITDDTCEFFERKRKELLDKENRKKRKTMRKEEFYEYIKEHFTIDVDGMRLIRNIIDWTWSQPFDKKDTVKALFALLEGIGITTAEIEQFIDWN